MPPLHKPTDERQAPPFCMQIELTEGCNLRCQFCGLNGIRGKDNDYKFMSVALARQVIERIKEAGWRPRIEFAMHGEPSMNPDFLTIVARFRKQLGPRIHLMMTSNGAGFVKDPVYTIDTTLTYLNVLALDWYDGIKLVPKILERYLEAPAHQDILTANHEPRHPPIFYPGDKLGNPHRRRKPDEHDLVIVQDIASATKGTHATLNNHAGCGAPKNQDAQGKRCAKPFRELSIRWDGSVALCCNDWPGHYRVGNVKDMTLEQLWQSPAMRAARRKLYHGQRDFGPCNGCDALSYRPGLLPDQLGKLTLPLPTEEDERAIRRALGQGPYTLRVLRPWELGE